MIFEERIKSQLISFLDNPKAKLSEVNLFVLNIRLLLELKKQTNKYPSVKLYCDWLVHSSLDRKASREKIEALKGALLSAVSKNELLLKISDILSTRQFIVELKDIIYTHLSYFGSNSEDDRFWIDFLKIYLNLICYKPLLFSSELSSVDVSEIGFDFKIYGLQFAIVKEEFCVEVLSKQLENLNKNLYFDFLIYSKL